MLKLLCNNFFFYIKKKLKFLECLSLYYVQFWVIKILNPFLIKHTLKKLLFASRNHCWSYSLLIAKHMFSSLNYKLKMFNTISFYFKILKHHYSGLYCNNAGYYFDDAISIPPICSLGTCSNSYNILASDG